MLDNQLRTELINLLCNYPPLTMRDGRDAWLINLPSRVRDLITRRHEQCRIDLAFIIDAFQSQQLADGRSPILVLIDALLPEMEDLISGRKLKTLRQQIESNLVGTPFLTQLENPFFHRTLIRDRRFFFGRTAETRKVLSLVTKKQPVSIVGPRRIGKSSLLLHLCDPQVKAAHGLGDDYVFVYVDCLVLSKDLTKSDVYRILLEDVVEATQRDHHTEYDSWGAMTYLDFEKCLARIIAPCLQIVFLFDEFEKIVDNHQLGHDFFDELRGLGQTGKVVYVVASGKTLHELSLRDENSLSSPFFNIFSTEWLGFLKPREARVLVDGLATIADFEGFDEDDHAFLQRIAGPYPFYLQVACSFLFEEKVERTGSSALDYDRVERQYAQEVQDHFQYTWDRLSNVDRNALRLISEGRLNEVTVKDRKRLGHKCLMYQDVIFSSSFAEFVHEQSQQLSQVCADFRQSNSYSHYGTGIQRLLDRIGQDHPRYLEALGYQQRLSENINKSRQYGDTEVRKAERSEIISRLNELVLSVLHVSFNILCELPEEQESVPVGTSQSARVQLSPTVPYGVLRGDLLWYRHEGWQNGAVKWSGRIKVGIEWDQFKFIFPGGEGVIYAVAPGGDLLWYRHDGWQDGAVRWSGKIKVGTGWDQFKFVFPGGEGIIYAVTPGGDLLWYRHDGWRDGAVRWSGKIKVGTEWDQFKFVFPGREGIIYAVTPGGDLLWYRHDGWQDGIAKWTKETKVSMEWNQFEFVFSGGDGIIYAITSDGDLIWWRHEGWRGGGEEWSSKATVGGGWDQFKSVFSGGKGVIYAVA
jgi:hypothetical protein